MATLEELTETRIIALKEQFRKLDCKHLGKEGYIVDDVEVGNPFCKYSWKVSSHVRPIDLILKKGDKTERLGLVIKYNNKHTFKEFNYYKLFKGLSSFVKLYELPGKFFQDCLILERIGGENQLGLNTLDNYLDSYIEKRKNIKMSRYALFVQNNAFSLSSEDVWKDDDLGCYKSINKERANRVMQVTERIAIMHAELTSRFIELYNSHNKDNIRYLDHRKKGGSFWLSSNCNIRLYPNRLPKNSSLNWVNKIYNSNNGDDNDRIGVVSSIEDYYLKKLVHYLSNIFKYIYSSESPFKPTGAGQFIESLLLNDKVNLTGWVTKPYLVVSHRDIHINNIILTDYNANNNSDSTQNLLKLESNVNNVKILDLKNMGITTPLIDLGYLFNYKNEFVSDQEIRDNLEVYVKTFFKHAKKYKSLEYYNSLEKPDTNELYKVLKEMSFYWMSRICNEVVNAKFSKEVTTAYLAHYIKHFIELDKYYNNTNSHLMGDTDSALLFHSIASLFKQTPNHM